jgi:hypothetical protein
MGKRHIYGLNGYLLVTEETAFAPGLEFCTRPFTSPSEYTEYPRLL